MRQRVSLPEIVSKGEPTLGGHSTSAWTDPGAFTLTEYRLDLAERNSRVEFTMSLRLSTGDQNYLSTWTDVLNPTLYEPVRFAPTVVHIETKLSGEGGRHAQLQLSLWMSQHVAKLRELLALAAKPDNTTIAVLPVLVV